MRYGRVWPGEQSHNFVDCGKLCSNYVWILHRSDFQRLFMTSIAKIWRKTKNPYLYENDWIYLSLSLIAHLLAPSLSLFSVYKIYHSVLADYISCTLTLGAQITKIWDAIALFLVYYCQLKWNSIRPVCRISLFLASSNLVIIQYLQCI